MKKLIVSTIISMAALALFAISVNAASILFGSAIDDGGWIKAISDTSVAGTPDDDYGGVAFDDAIGTTFASLTNLSTDFNVTDDDCGGGSPRFYIRMDTDGDSNPDGNVFVYMGPMPSFTGCTPNTWANTGNLIGSADARFDLTQLGGPFYGTYANALALVGGGTILRIGIVVDAGWAMPDKEQTVLFDNTVINGNTYTYPYQLKGKDVKKATGGIWMGNPSQQMQFSAFDQGDTVWDKGTVEYWNYEYPGLLHYTANVLCANVDQSNGDARFMFQIPDGWPGLSGLYVVSGVHDGGTPGTDGDTYGHAATSDMATAQGWCENGVSPTLYTIVGGNLVVHK